MHSEFQYEQQIREDEERIARYFDNLPLFMDLPGEDEAIFERIAKTTSEKVPHSDTLRSMTAEYEAYAEDDEEFSRSDRSVFRPEEYEMLDIIDSISLLYAERFAVSENAECTEKILAVICQSGKTLARISDLLYADEEHTALRTALAKRALHDLSDLIQYVSIFNNCQPDSPCCREIDILHIVRSKILNILFELKKN